MAPHVAMARVAPPGVTRGTLWVQDPRALHRGTPNRSHGPRPELVICYCCAGPRRS